MTSKTAGGGTHTYISLSKVVSLLPTFFFSLFSVTFLLFVFPVQFVHGKSSVSGREANVYATFGDFKVRGETSGVSFANNVLTINGGEPTIAMKDGVTSTTQRIEVTDETDITFVGVHIDRTGVKEDAPKAALKIADNAGFDVNITLAENSNNVLNGEAGDRNANIAGSSGIEKNDDGTVANLGTLTIKGAGSLTATGGNYASGIGSGYNSRKEAGYNVSNITINDATLTVSGGQRAAGIGGGNNKNGNNIIINSGKVTVNGGQFGAGIGGGSAGNGTGITISGGTVIANGGEGGASGIGGGFSGNATDIVVSGGKVTATGHSGGAGIGGGFSGMASEIAISGGSITAIGGYTEFGAKASPAKNSGAGIGSGAAGRASGNTLSGNAVVLAISGEDLFADGIKPQLDGFAEKDKTGGVVFVGEGTYENKFDDIWVLKSTVWKEGVQYGNSTTITEDVTFPADFTIASTATLIVGKNAAKEATLSMAEGKKLIVNGSLINEGILDIPAESIVCNGSGTVTTRMHFYLLDGTVFGTDDYYQTYQTAAGQQKFTNLSSPDDTTIYGNNVSADKFEYWYYLDEDGNKVPINDDTDVLLNQHSFYEKSENQFIPLLSRMHQMEL